MNTKQIKSKIQNAINDEKRTSRLASSVLTLARNNGVNPTKEQIQGVVNFVMEYAQQVPNILEQGIAAARQLGLVHEMNQMTSELEAYWLIEDDLIPDHLGLVGIMDDAYASMLLLQSLAEYCKNTVRQSFLAQDLTLANYFIRQLIGEPVASILDQRVGLTIGQAMLNRLVSQLVTGGLVIDNGPDPYWGGVSLDEYVDVQMGALGIV